MFNFLNFNTKNIVTLHIIIIFLAVFSNSCSIYGQNNQNQTDKDKIKNLTESNKILQLRLNESDRQSPNQSIPINTQIINSNPNNNTGALGPPVGNVTDSIWRCRPMAPSIFLNNSRHNYDDTVSNRHDLGI